MYVNELVSAELATRTAAPSDERSFSNKLALFVGRMRFQLLGGFIAAVVIPVMVRYLYEAATIGTSLAILERLDMSIHNLDNSLFGTLWAFLLGYVLFRKVIGYPGVKASALILPVFAASYLVVLASFFLVRLEYSRIQFIVSFVLSSVFFYAVFALVRLLQPRVER